MNLRMATKALIELLLIEKGADFVNSGIILRTADGSLAFAVECEVPEAEEDRLKDLLSKAIPYCKGGRVLIGGRPPSIFDDPNVKYNAHYMSRILDRFIIGADWGSEMETKRKLNRFVFWSGKDGVAKTKAAVYSAQKLAEHGLKVLLVDMDLESPSLGSYIPDLDLAENGITEYLLRRNFGIAMDVKSLVIQDFQHPTLHIVTAVGTEDERFPTEYRGKLSRALLEELPFEISIAGKLGSMLDQLEDADHYDVVLIDAPTGLSEIAATPLRHLGARILNVNPGSVSYYVDSQTHNRFQGVASSEAALEIILSQLPKGKKA